MKKKKILIIVSVLAIFIILLIASILLIVNHNSKLKEAHYQAQLKDNTIIKYLSQNDIIKVIFKDNESNIYYNDKKVGTVKIKNDNGKIIEEYYDLDIDDYSYKRVIYKNNDDLMDYSELYDYSDTLINTIYFKDNKVRKIVYNNSFKVDEFKKEGKKITKYTYKKDILYSKCKYDDKNIYITFCEFYDKQGNVISTRENKYNEYGFEIARTNKDVIDKTTETISFEMKRGKINSKYQTHDNKETKIILSIYDFSSFGSKVLYNTPYLYNDRYYYHTEKFDNNVYYYDNKNNNNVEVEIDSNGYTKTFQINLEEKTEFITLYQGVKFKSYNDVIGYYNNLEDNIYNISGYSYEKKEFIKDAHVKSVYGSGNVKYYDWFSENEISEEEYNLMLKELNS